MSKVIKQIYLVRGTDQENYVEFGERVKKTLAPLPGINGIINLSYTITEEKPPTISIIPFSKNKIASISIKRRNDKPEESIVKMDGFDGGYSITEALPVAYEKTWEDGELSPGVCLLTLFQQKKNIDRSTFIDRWHNSHTPLSLKIHPLWHYNRNVVDSALTEASAPWQGIVEEHMRTRSELLNPFKFFGPPHLILQRMLQVYTDTKSFLDYKTIETYLVAEYHLKS